MNSINNLNKIPVLSKNVEIIKRENRYIITFINGNNNLTISEQTYILLSFIEKDKTINEITDDYNTMCKTNIDPFFVFNFFYETLGKHNIIESDNNSNETLNVIPSYLKLSKVIISKEVVSRMSNIFSFLFKKNVFFFLMISSSFFLIIIFFIHFNEVQLFLKLLNSKNLSIFIVIMMFSGLFHELGHTSAAKFYGARVGGIGFGFYLLTPVLFADVSNIWVLNKRKRIIVNIGGIYFELLFASFLIIISYLVQYKVLLILPLLIVFKTLFNLNPFMRNDGYWILSDSIDVPNLKSYSSKIMFDLIRRKTQKTSGKEYLLALYSALNYIIIYLFLIGIIIITPNSIITFPKDLFNEIILIKETKSINYDDLLELLMPLTFYVLIIQLLINKIKNGANKAK